MGWGDSTTFVYWKMGFRKLVEQITSNSKGMSYRERLENLEKLLPFLEKEGFLYKSPSDRSLGCLALLKWYYDQRTYRLLYSLYDVVPTT
jgi:uncharacterized membrane protein (UPF0182 family)